MQVKFVGKERAHHHPRRPRLRVDPGFLLQQEGDIFCRQGIHRHVAPCVPHLQPIRRENHGDDAVLPGGLLYQPQVSLGDARGKGVSGVERVAARCSEVRCDEHGVAHIRDHPPDEHREAAPHDAERGDGCHADDDPDDRERRAYPVPPEIPDREREEHHANLPSTIRIVRRAYPATAAGTSIPPSPSSSPVRFSSEIGRVAV